MILKKPYFWKNINFYSILLLPFSLITFLIIYFKKLSVKKRKINIPIICVGNIYLGGTGKTPLSIHLYDLLKKKKFKPAIVRKFYPSHLDEINLIKSRVKQLFFSSNRFQSITEAKRRKNNIIILDDGFQDDSIKKNLNIICFNSLDLSGNNFLIPAGPLREPLKNIKNSQVVVINGKRNINFEKKLKSISKKTKIFYSRYIILKNNIGKKNVFAFAGIGNPQGFFSLLKENNFKVEKQISFPDHYDYKKREIDKMIKEAKEKNLKLITTEKDFFRMKKMGIKKIAYIKINLKILKSKTFEKEMLKNIW